MLRLPSSLGQRGKRYETQKDHLVLSHSQGELRNRNFKDLTHISEENTPRLCSGPWRPCCLEKEVSWGSTSRSMAPVTNPATKQTTVSSWNYCPNQQSKLDNNSHNSPADLAGRQAVESCGYFFLSVAPLSYVNYFVNFSITYK